MVHGVERLRAHVGRTSDMDPGFFPLYKACRGYTLTSVERMFAVYTAVQYVVRSGVPSAFLEAGVARGGSSMLAGATFAELGAGGRELHLFDTFAGMPPPGELDVDPKGAPPPDDVLGWYKGDLEAVRKRVLSVGVAPDRLHMIPGRVEDTIPAKAPGELAILRIDVDWYEPTRHVLAELWPRLADGGVLILDDYGHWQGARRAADEFFADVSGLLHRVDFYGRVLVKTPGVGAPPGLVPATKI